MSIKFNIYYGTTPDGPWTLANPTPIDRTVNETNYTVTGLNSDTQYYFNIVGGVLDGSGNLIEMVSQPIGPKTEGAAGHNSVSSGKITARTFAAKVQTDGSVSYEFTIELSPHFEVHFDTSGVDSLPTDLTINGLTVSPFLVMDARDISEDGTTWPARIGSGVFTLSGAGDDPVKLDTAFLDGTQETRKQSIGRYWQTDFDDVTNFDLKDFAFVVVAKTDDAGGASSAHVGTANPRIFTTITAGRIQATLYDSVGTGTAINGPILEYGAMAVHFVAGDRSSVIGGAAYSNGAKGTVVDLTPRETDSLSPASGFMRILTGSSTNAGILYIAAYRKTDWLNGITTEVDDLAKELFAKFNGTWADAADQQYPTFGRATPATITNQNTGVVNLVSSYWPVVEAMQVAWPSTENLLTYSDFSSNWTNAKATSVISTTVFSPNGSAALEVTENTDIGFWHGVYQTYTYSVNDYIYSAYFKKGDRRWVSFYSNPGVLNTYAWFDLDTGTVGTQTNCVGYIEAVGDDGWFRIEVVFTGTSGVDNVVLQHTTGNGVKTFTGDGVSKFYISDAQLEIDHGTGRATDLVETEASPVTFRRTVPPIGYKPESLATNLITNSDLRTGWTDSLGSGIASITVRAPDGTFAEQFQDSVTSGLHGVYQSYTYIAATDYIFSAYVKKGSQDWIFLRSEGTAQSAHFDISNGLTGTVTGGGSSYITDLKNGWYRIEHQFTAVGGVVNVVISSMDADVNFVYSGAGDLSSYWWGAQVELDNGTGRASSYIPSDGSPGTRNGTNLEYSHTRTPDRSILDIEHTIVNLDKVASGGGGFTSIAWMQAHASWSLPYLLISAHYFSEYILTRLRPVSGVVDIQTASGYIINGTTYSHRSRWRIGTGMFFQEINGTEEGTNSPGSDSIGECRLLRLGTSVDGSVGNGGYIKSCIIRDD